MSYSGSGLGGNIHTDGDVALDNPTNGQVLSYNSSLAKWQNQTASGSSLAVADAGTWDTSTSYTAGQIVTYSGARYMTPLGASSSSFFDTTQWVLLGTAPDSF